MFLYQVYHLPLTHDTSYNEKVRLSRLAKRIRNASLRHRRRARSTTVPRPRAVTPPPTAATEEDANAAGDIEHPHERASIISIQAGSMENDDNVWNNDAQDTWDSEVQNISDSEADKL